MRASAGNRDRRILVQRWTPAVDTAGQEVEGWTDVMTLWASVEEGSGDETFQADQRTQAQTMTFEILYVPGIVPTHTIVYKEKRYDIKEIAEVGRRDGLRIVAEVRAKKS